MGNDGGSIARRDELVKVKETKRAQDPAQLKRIQWTTCRLSRKPLREPVVADGMGRLYNKEALVNYLIEVKVGEAKGNKILDPAMSHIRGLKDVTQLKLHASAVSNRTAQPPALASSAPSPPPTGDDEQALAPFSCPLTNKPMNGSVRFVYIKAGGAVMSESGLKSILDGATTAGSTVPCPITATPFHPGWLVAKGITSTEKMKTSSASLEEFGDVFPLNPTAEEEEALRAVGLLVRNQARETKRRRNAEGASGGIFCEAGKKRKLAQQNGHGKAQASSKERERRPIGERADLALTKQSGNSSPHSAASAIATLAAQKARQGEETLSSNAFKSIYGTQSRSTASSL